MASRASGPSRGEAQNTSVSDWLSCTWHKALQERRDGVVDLLRGTKLQPMADALAFWAYSLENAFPEELHSKPATLMNESFDPTNGISETMGRSNKTIKGQNEYKVLIMCKHPCVCADMYAGLTNHTIFQWGRPQSDRSFPEKTWSAPSPRLAWRSW